MKTKRNWRRSGVIGLIIAIAATIGVSTQASAGAKTACDAAIVVIGVRGTDQPAGSDPAIGGRLWRTGGLGMFVQDAVWLSTSSDMVASTFIASLNYPASSLINYLDSRDAGAKALKEEIEYYWSSCTYKPAVALVGYSQGADVVIRALGSMSANARSLVKGVVLMGDPTYQKDDAVNVRDSDVYNTTNNGIFSRYSPSDTAIINGMTRPGWVFGSTGTYGSNQVVRSYCFQYDAVCAGNPGSTVGWDRHSKMYQSYIPLMTSFLRFMLMQQE